MASGWFDNLRRMLGWWSAPGATPPENDYSVLSRHTFTARRRTSECVSASRATASTSRARSTQSIAADRPTTNTARTRATEG